MSISLLSRTKMQLASVHIIFFNRPRNWIIRILVDIARCSVSLSIDLYRVQPEDWKSE